MVGQSRVRPEKTGRLDKQKYLLDEGDTMKKEGGKKEIIYTCCICGWLTKGYGNNPQPVKPEGRCCDTCNSMHVIPARLKMLMSK